MIKVNAVRQANGVVAITFQSNSPEADQDQLDLIGAAIVNKEYDRVGGFSLTSPGVLQVQALDVSTKTQMEV